MTFKLKPELRLKIIEELSSGFKSLQVECETFPNYLSFFMASYLAQKNLPENGPNRDYMERFIGEMPLIEFIVEKIRLELMAERDYNSESPRSPLIGSSGYPSAGELAERLVAEFESLPWVYRITIELSQKQVPPELFDGGSISIGDNATLHKPDLLFSEAFPLDHENHRISRRMRSIRGLGALMLLGDKKEDWKPEAICFTQVVKGFIGAFGGQEPVQLAQNQLESFIGLGLAKKCFTFKNDFKDPAPQFRWIVHQVDEDGQNVPMASLSVDDELSSTLKSIRSFIFSENYPEYSRVPWLIRQLKEISLLYDAQKNENLLLASKWFFDSFKGSDEALRYVRRMTCLEILLGSSVNTQKTSLSEIMSNRLAYMIGKSFSEREKIMSEFKEIYNLRSRILHQGKHRLGYRESRLRSTLQEFCEKAIDAECKLLIASIES